MDAPAQLRSIGSAARMRTALFVLHALVVLSLAWWVRTLDVAFGVAAAIAQLAAAVAALQSRRRLAAAAFIATVTATGILVARYSNPWRPAAQDLAAPGAAGRAHEEALARAIFEAGERLVIAATAVAAGADPQSALPGLPSAVGLVAFNGDSTVGWAGRTVVPVRGLWERTGVVVTPMYVVQYAAVLRGDRRAVASNVISARPPADRLTPSLASALDAGGTVWFDVGVAVGGARPGVVTARLGETTLTVRARVADPAAVAATIEQRARSHASLLLLLTTLVALATLLRRAERLPERVGVTLIPLAAIAITPLNSLSNVTRLFDPTNFYVAGGGPFTASVGAFGLTSLLVLFAVMAAVRWRGRPGRKGVAVVAVIAAASLGPYLLRHLARGINLPPSGAGTGLWLAWEVALFLAATSFVAAAATAAHWALGQRRGFPLWVAPVIAAVATVLGPVLLAGAASWPVWYPALWACALATVILARRSRGGIFATAFVAGCGATILLWGATLRERVESASRDVSAMGAVDFGAVALLDRLANDVAGAPAPRTPEDLLARFAAADIAAADYPVVLGYWPATGSPTFLRLGANARGGDVVRVVDAVRRSGTSLVTALPANPASALVLAIPFDAGDVFTAVVGARTRLSRTPTYFELLGLEPPPTQPPFELAIVDTPDDSVSSSWVRRGASLQSYWALPAASGGTTHVRAVVEFEPLETLIPRGMLLVLLNVGIVAVLLVVDLLADGILGRWIRMRRMHWLSGYRVRLSLALFAFFVVPALAFATWSYRRLHGDDRAARALLVRESLRRAVVEPPPSGFTTGRESVPKIAGVPGDTPLLVYRGGQLVATSDSLVLALAPLGRWLNPQVVRLLDEGDDVVVTAPTPVGGRDLLFGYRRMPGTDLVIATPARRDDAALDKRRSDLGVLVILVSVLGGIAALWLSGVASRQLARPIGALRDAALAVAGGSRAPLDGEAAPSEFMPVFRAFDRMARDLSASEAQLAHAERVFAWGEMARQVAHEIKNPLTPIRLGVQHMRRAWRDRSPEFGNILEDNSARVLREIDHLDATARSFSRFGMPPDARATIEVVDVAPIVRDVAALQAIGTDHIEWRALGAAVPCRARARAHELHEVLLNLCDNARNADARRVEIRLERTGEQVVISVVDDGTGVPAQYRSRVFEPHFSTRTSGSGLGLAISRRLVEGWGGSIELDDTQVGGTTVRITLSAPGLAT